MTEPASVYEAQPADAESLRVAALMDELEKKQGEFLDEAGNRIIQLCTALLGIVFAVTAFGDKFPPAYLRYNALAKGLLVGALILYLAAIGLSLVALGPRPYPRYTANVSAMREVIAAMLKFKSRWLRLAAAAFALGLLALAGLVTLLVITA